MEMRKGGGKEEGEKKKRKVGLFLTEVWVQEVKESSAETGATKQRFEL
jgi:hypothetical protein